MQLSSFTEAEKVNLSQAMLHVWNTIGSDVLNIKAQEDEDASCTQEEVIEMVLDCDRLEMYGFYQATQQERELIKRFRALSYADKQAFAKTVFTYEEYV